jgi:fructose-1,6-bisphosphatase/inositol monophosphatase family enzyme
MGQKAAPHPLTDEAIDQYLEFACRVAELAGAAIMSHFRSGLGAENKSAVGYDPVTPADREAEQIIRREIARTYPSHSISGEEYGRRTGLLRLRGSSTQSTVHAPLCWGFLSGAHWSP